MKGNPREDRCDPSQPAFVEPIDVVECAVLSAQPRCARSIRWGERHYNCAGSPHSSFVIHHFKLFHARNGSRQAEAALTTPRCAKTKAGEGTIARAHQHVRCLSD